MTRIFRQIGVTVGAVLVAACASTSIKSSWRDPAATAQSLRFRRIVVVALMRDSATRRVAEDELAGVINRGPRGRAGEVQAVAGYTLLGEDDLRNVEAAKAKIRPEGFDGAITMRLVGKDQRVTYVPAAPAPPIAYGRMWGYYGGAGGALYDPGYLRTDTVVSVETNVYSVTDEKLLWSGVSETFDPRDARTLVDDVARAVAKALEKEGLLAPSGDGRAR
jgi:hypothetical protein